MKYLLLIVFFFSFIAKAETPTVNIVAHLGMSYTIDAVTYGIWSNGFRMVQTPAIFFAAGSAALVCLSYAAISHSTDKLALPMDGLGILAFSLSSKLFHWEFKNLPLIEDE